MKYRKKPVVIEAFQLNERGLVGEDWFWDAVSNNDIITYHFGKFYPEPAWCEIKTLEEQWLQKQEIILFVVLMAKYIRVSQIYLSRHTNR